MRKVLLLMATAMMILTSTAQSQETRKRPTEPIVLQVSRVAPDAPKVDLKSVGREVSQGVYEVDPAAIRGKRLVIPPGLQRVIICIGRKNRDCSCDGIYIEL